MEEFVKDYILSQIEPTTPSNQINILTQEEHTSENFGYAYVQCGDYIVFYDNVELGMVFYVYDKSMNLIKTETLEDDVSAVGVTLKQDENGNFYFLGNVESGSTTYYSLILLNNIIKEHPVIRKWYKLEPMGITYAHDCQKKIGSANYLFVYEKSRSVSGSTVFDLYLVEFIISVQNGNSHTTWVYKNYSSLSSTLDTLIPVGYQYNEEISKLLVIKKRSDRLLVNLINLSGSDWQSDTTNEISLGNGVEISKTLNETTYDLLSDNSVIVNGINSFVFIRNSDSKMVQYNILDNFTNPKSIDLPGATVIDYVFNNNYVGFVRGYVGEYTLRLYKYELTENSIIISDNYLEFTFDYEYDITEYILNMSLINTNIYNLVYIAFVLVEISGNGVSVIITSDNSSEEYTNYNLLVPSYVNLSDNSANLFSRKITNKTIVGNQMSAEVNVPYSMLNDIYILNEKLMSETNAILFNENKEIIKNSYESLYLNFIQYINVIDNNFGKNELQNSISNLLCKSLFDKSEENYNVAPIGYAKIDTIDGQEIIFTIGNDLIEPVSPNEFIINIAINGHNVNRLQILAKDKQTPYVTIPLYSIDNVILIKQRVLINNSFDNRIITENNEFIITENNEFVIGG